MTTKLALAGLLAALVMAGCYRPDPRVQAAQDFQKTAFDLIEKDEARTKKLNSLRLGMTDDEVIRLAGPPSSRQTLEGGQDRQNREARRELWTYSGELKTLGTLTFEDQRLAQISVN
jgi:hypothetical protein